MCGVGPPGSGETTLAQQIVFSNASPERPALYFTVLGEPPLKMLRCQQQFEFFDPEKVDRSIRFVNLSDEVMAEGIGTVLVRIGQAGDRQRSREAGFHHHLTKPGELDELRRILEIRSPGSGATERSSNPG